MMRILFDHQGVMSLNFWNFSYSFKLMFPCFDFHLISLGFNYFHVNLS